MKLFLILLFCSTCSVLKMSDTEVDDSMTLDYSYCDAVDLGVSAHDQTMSSFDFNPDNE